MERECYSLEGGYVGYVTSRNRDTEDRENKQKKAEESIQKKYHKQLFSPFARACKTYQLIEEGDHIAVCISGGKDSMLIAKLKEENPFVEANIFKSVENVNLSTIVAYKKDGVRHSFLDEY